MSKIAELEMRRLVLEPVSLTLELTPFLTLLFWLLNCWEMARARGKVKYFRRKNMNSFPRLGTGGKSGN